MTAKPTYAPPADRERVIVEMRHAAGLLGDTQVAHDLLEWADELSRPEPRRSFGWHDSPHWQNAQPAVAADDVAEIVRDLRRVSKTDGWVCAGAAADLIEQLIASRPAADEPIPYRITPAGREHLDGKA